MSSYSLGMVVLTIVLLIILKAYGSEVDNFTYRFESLADSSEAIAKKADEMFEQALVEANKKSNCSEKRLYSSLRKRFRNHVQGEFNRWLAHTKDIPKRPTNYGYSIYQGFKWHESLALTLKNVYKDTAADVISMNGIQIGTDKIEHFFGRGFVYFNKHYRKGKSLEKVLKFGHFSERYMLGGVTTGVYSFGDLASNFTGMRFWNHVLQKGEDVFGENLGPYAVCDNGKWRINRKDRQYVIDWKKYINVSWDEANNCAIVRSQNMLDKVMGHLDKLSLAEGRSYACPMEPEKIQAVADQYGELVSSYVINQKGLDSFNFFK